MHPAIITNHMCAFVCAVTLRGLQLAYNLLCWRSEAHDGWFESPYSTGSEASGSRSNMTTLAVVAFMIATLLAHTGLIFMTGASTHATIRAVACAQSHIGTVIFDSTFGFLL